MGFGDMKDMFSQMREAQKMAKQVQQKLGEMRIEIETGGGTVKAIVDGEANLVDLILDTELLDGDELKILPKLIKKAIQQAQKKAKDEAAAQMKSLAGGLNIPGMG